MLNFYTAKNTVYTSLKWSLINYVVSTPHSHILCMNLQPADVKLLFYSLHSSVNAAVKTSFRLMSVFKCYNSTLIYSFLQQCPLLDGMLHLICTSMSALRHLVVFHWVIHMKDLSWYQYIYDTDQNGTYTQSSGNVELLLWEYC